MGPEEPASRAVEPLQHPGPPRREHARIFQSANWTELDIWQYIAREKLELPSLYFAHTRKLVARSGLYLPVSELVQPRDGEEVVEKRVRFRTLGDMTCTCPVLSDADTVEAIVEETMVAKHTERGATRLDDQTSDASMELRKKEGYF